jgi:hypothetical protein
MKSLHFAGIGSAILALFKFEHEENPWTLFFQQADKPLSERFLPPTENAARKLLMGGE